VGEGLQENKQEKNTMSKAIDTASRNVAHNTLLDRGMQGIASAALVGLAYQDLLNRYVHAVFPLAYALAGMALGLILFCVLAPLFRR
jgi:hypothetical protein